MKSNSSTRPNPTKLLDTVALVAYTEPSNPLHTRAITHVRSITSSNDVFVPSVALVELDFVMKKRGFNYHDRETIFELLSTPIPSAKIVKLTPDALKRAAVLDGVAGWASHYFDVMMVAMAEMYTAELITTDHMIPTLGIPTSW